MVPKRVGWEGGGKWHVCHESSDDVARGVGGGSQSSDCVSTTWMA